MRQLLMVISLLLAAGSQAASKNNSDLLERSEKVNELLNKCQGAPAPAKKSIYAVYLRGNAAFDAVNNRSAGDEFLQTMSDVAKKRGYEIKSENLWWGLQGRLCERILANKPTHIVVVGHSAGSPGSRTLAKCLNQSGRDIDVLVTFAAFDYDQPVSEPNVVSHYNYLIETVYLRGSEKESNGRTKTINYYTKSTSPKWAHLNGPTYLSPLFVLQAYADLEGHYDNIKIEKNFVAENALNQLQDFVACH